MAEEKGCCSLLRKVLGMIDYFGVTFFFRINKKSRFGSGTGGCLFLLYLVFAIGFIVFTLLEWSSGTKINVYTIDKSIIPAPKLNFGDNKFNFAVRITFDNDTNIGNSTLKDMIQFNTNLVVIDPKYRNKTNPSGKVKYNIESRECVEEDFYSSSKDPIFSLLNYSDFLCFDNAKNLTIEGIYTDKTMSYVEYTTFLNPEYMKNYQKLVDIFNENQFKLTVYYIDTLYDVSSNEKTAVFFQMNTIYTYIDLQFFKRLNVDFQTFVYDLDKNLLTANYKNTTYMKLFNKDEIFVTLFNRETTQLSDKLNLVKLYLRSNNFQKIIRRSYQKIPDLLAGISGLLVNLLICLGVVMTVLNEFKAKQNIMNGLLHYKDIIKHKYYEVLHSMNEKFNDPKIRSLISEKKDKDFPLKPGENIKNTDVDFPLPKNVVSHEINIATSSSKKEPPNIGDDQYAQNKEPLRSRSSWESISESENDKKNAKPIANHWNITCKDLCCLIFCCRSFKKKKLMYEASESKFNYNIDIITYLKKMQEIDIIKYLLLDVDTLNLMNFISKPSVSLTKSNIDSKEYKTFFDNNETAIALNEDNIEKLKKSYLRILSKPQISYHEKRILELFDLQIKEILQ